MQQLDRYQNRKTLTRNVALLLIGIAVPWGIIFQIIGQSLLSFICWPVVLVLSLCLYLNQRFPTISRLGLVICTWAAVLFYASSLGRDSGIQWVFYGLSAVSFVVFGEKEWQGAVFGIALSIGGLILLEITNYALFPTVILPKSQLQFVYITIMLMTFSMIIFAIYFYYNSSKIALLDLEQAVSDLNLSNAQLESANRVLKSQSERLAEAERYRAYALLTEQIAHELKNPLHLLGMTTYGLQFVIDQPDRLKSAIGVVDQTVKDMQSVLSGMLSAAGGGTVLEKLQVQSTLEKIIKLSKAKCVQQNIKMVDYLHETPGVMGTQRGMFQIFTNLISNALAVMPDGGELYLSTETESRDGIEGVCVCVRDTGPGLSKEQQATFFNQEVALKDNGEQHRFGLAIVQGLVNDFKGKITLESDPEHRPGTQLKLWFPNA
ncbi:MAG: sensor histidine kinase [Candidatus Margulisiibacteriota bacterium]